MDIRRAIWGPVLSLVFLLFFVYAFFDMQGFFEKYITGTNIVEATGSFSNAVKTATTQDNNALAFSLQPVSAIIPDAGVNAKAAISVESNLWASDRVVFEKNSNLKLPIASLTKLMTAAVVLDNYKLSDIIIVDKAADSQDPVKQDVKFGDALPVESFLEIMLVSSSNKSAYALAEGFGGSVGEQKFVWLMNQKAKTIGLWDTFFVDPTGLSSENVSTASDLVKFAKYILRGYPKISDISRSKSLYVPNFGEITNTDQLLGEIPDAVCSKTGFTNEANGCLLLAVRNEKNNNYLINVILGSDDRFVEMKKIINLSSATCQ